MLVYQWVLKRKWVDLLLKLVPPTLYGWWCLENFAWDDDVFSAEWNQQIADDHNLVGRSRAYTSGNQTWQPKVLYTWCLNDLNGKIIELHGRFSSKPRGKLPDFSTRQLTCKAYVTDARIQSLFFDRGLTCQLLRDVGWIETTHQSSFPKSPCWWNHLTRPGKLTKSYWKWPSRNSWFTL